MAPINAELRPGFERIHYEGRTITRACKPGHFKAVSGYSLCHPCPANSTASEAGYTRCFKCSTGTTANEGHTRCGASADECDT